MSLVLIKKEDISAFKYPGKVSLCQKYIYYIYNQRSIQMCESCAWISFIEYMRQIEGFPFKRFSVFYLYYYARIIDNKKGQNAPITTNSIIKTLLEGIPSDEHWPFDFSLCDDEPPLDVRIDAKEHASFVFFEKLEVCIETIKFILGTCGKPVVCNIHISRENLNGNQHKIIKDSHGQLKVHCVLLVGYDDDDECLIFQNSFGSSWGFSGFGKLHYSFMNRITNCYTMPSSCIKDIINPETAEEDLSFLVCTVSRFALQNEMSQEGELLYPDTEDTEFLKELIFLPYNHLFQS